MLLLSVGGVASTVSLPCQRMHRGRGIGREANPREARNGTIARGRQHGGRKMATWSRCTRSGARTSTVYINLENVLTVDRFPQGYTLITLRDGKTETVQEEPDIVLRPISVPDADHPTRHDAAL